MGGKRDAKYLSSRLEKCIANYCAASFQLDHSVRNPGFELSLDWLNAYS
jgi:hypothetical protein